MATRKEVMFIYFILSIIFFILIILAIIYVKNKIPEKTIIEEIEIEEKVKEKPRDISEAVGIGAFRLAAVLGVTLIIMWGIIKMVKRMNQ